MIPFPFKNVPLCYNSSVDFTSFSLNKGSISSTFYARIFCTNFLPKQNVTRHVTGEKLPKQRSYEKFVLLTLMKLTQAYIIHRFSTCAKNICLVNLMLTQKLTCFTDTICKEQSTVNKFKTNLDSYRIGSRLELAR